MKETSPLQYLEEEVFPEIEGLEYEDSEEILSEEFDSYNVDREEQLLTDDTEELRSYDVEYGELSFMMSVELGTFDGDRAIGISVDTSPQQENIEDLPVQIAEAHNTSEILLSHGDYILDIEDWEP